MLGVFSAAAMRPVATTPVLKSRRSPSASNAANMSERGDIWLSRSFSVTCILSAFIGAVTVGMLLGEPDLVIMLFGAVGGVMVGAVFFVAVAGVIRLCLTARNHDLAGKVLASPKADPPRGEHLYVRSLGWSA